MGLILFAYGFWTLVYQPHLRENIATSNFSQTNLASNSAQLPQNIIKVDVEGAVINPGVYAVPVDARVQDGLVVAGGLSGNADRIWVAQHVNLALKLIDGTKIYIPSLGEIAKTGSTVTDQTIGTDVLGAQNQQIDINSAASADLDSLPGVGPATVQKIIAGRPYTSTQELVDKKIVGQKEFEKIKDLIIVQ